MKSGIRLLLVIVCLCLLGWVTYARAGCLPAPANLVAWWPAEGNAGEAIAGNSGALSNGVTFVAGKVGQAFSFNGSNSFVEVPDAPALQLTSELTIEFWVKRQRLDYYDYIVEKGGDWTRGQQNYAVALHVASYNYCLHFLFNGGWRGAGSIADTNWHHCAVTARNGDTDPTFYIDGVQQPVTVSEGVSVIDLHPSTRPLHIGSQFDPGGFTYFGAAIIDELSFYDRVLSDSEIQAVFDADSSGKCPVAPTISVQPVDQTVTVGAYAIFSVGAGGSPPLSYQWQINGAPLPGATNASLTLTNVQMSDAGSYSVVVSNSLGSVTSSSAVLTVNPPPPCVQPPPNLVSWWPGEGDAGDAAGANSGIISNGVSFVSGMVGQAMSFDGVSSFVQVPDSPSLRLTNELTIEFWVKRQRLDYYDYIVEKGGDWTAGAQNYAVALHIASYNFCPHFLFAGGWRGGGSIGDTNWHHCAVTARNGDADPNIYIDGVLQTIDFRDGATTINLYPSTRPLHIGAQYDPTRTSYFGKAIIDELAFYDRALSDAEIQALFAAGAAGKCPGSNPPNVSVQPSNQTATIGGTAKFLIAAGGTPLLKYQWLFNGVPLTGSSGYLLTLANVQPGQAGNYSAVVSNAFGSVTSAVATLSVVFPPAQVRLSNTNIASGAMVSLPVQLVANGNENALAFSLNFDPTKLTYASATVGSGAPGAVLMPNNSLVNSGKLGINVALPPGTTFAPGTQTIAQINFVAAVLSIATPTPITFGDQPTPRQLLDPQLGSLAANYSTATVTIAAATSFEGDVFPRPNGDKNTTLTDWLQMGRYVARLDYPTNAAEFQRADCAPRDTLGDGAIKVTDWVQTGRYASGLDPLTPIGGPTNEIVVPDAGPSASRIITAGTASLLPGQTGTIAVTLAAQGNENALGFSLSFDPAVVILVGAAAGSAAGSATLYVNTNQAGSGRVGFALARAAGDTFPAGTQELVRVSFRASGSPGNFSLAFSNLPVPREVSDTTAAARAASYVNGAVSVGAPALQIGRAGQTVLLSWPQTASNYVLQENLGGLLPNPSWTNVLATIGVVDGQNVVTQSVTGSNRFYRLHYSP